VLSEHGAQIALYLRRGRGVRVLVDVVIAARDGRGRNALHKGPQGGEILGGVAPVEIEGFSHGRA